MKTTSIKRFVGVVKVLAVIVFCASLTSVTFGQTAAGTAIVNQASATYSDGSGGSYSTVSNTVTVTVARVSGLAITLDGGTRPSVVPGQTGVLYSFTVTNTGNFADQVRFLASGQSMQLTGSGTITRAVIDSGTTTGTIDAGDTNIFTNAADVLSASIAQNGTITVLVEVSVNAAATPTSTINVQLGDATTGAPSYDNQPAPTTPSAHEVRTVSTTSVNGLREARGDVSATVDNDAQLQLTLTAPSGPLALGSNINYNWGVCNTGQRTVNSVTLTNAPSGSNTGVFIIAPIPVGTALATGQTFPAGTLYTTSALTVTPLNAVWTTTPPASLSAVTRMAFRVGASLAAGGCSASFPMQVTITTTDATNDIYEIGDVFGTNTVNATITDQSGDTVSNAGDGNANFDEGNQPGNVDGNGIQQITTLLKVGEVYIGPLNSPEAQGPNSNNDDYTNKTISVPGIPQGGVTTATGVIVFDNTIRNKGNATDTIVISRQSSPTTPAGWTVEVSTNGGTSYTLLTTNTVSLSVARLADANIKVRVTAPVGTAVLQAGGFPTVMRVASTNTTTAFNETIDRFYTGAFLMTKSANIINATGVGNATDAVPGADIEWVISYQNITSNGGTGNSQLTLSNVVITENGATAPNNWASTTTQVVGSASDTNSGTITGDTAGSNVLTDTVTTLAPQASGTFRFRRRIN